MPHLLPPSIIVEDAPALLATLQGNRMTPIKATDFFASPGITNTAYEWTPPATEWFLMNEEFYTTEHGEASFGLACGSIASIQFDTSATDPLITTVFYLSIYLDGVVADNFSMGSSASITRNIAFTATPCGVVLTIKCIAASFASPGIPALYSTCTFDVISIT